MQAVTSGGAKIREQVCRKRRSAEQAACLGWEEGAGLVGDAPQPCLLLAQVPQGIHLLPCQTALLELEAVGEGRDVGLPLLLCPPILQPTSSPS